MAKAALPTTPAFAWEALRSSELGTWKMDIDRGKTVCNAARAEVSGFDPDLPERGQPISTTLAVMSTFGRNDRCRSRHVPARLPGGGDRKPDKGLAAPATPHLRGIGIHESRFAQFGITHPDDILPVAQTPTPDAEIETLFEIEYRTNPTLRATLWLCALGRNAARMR